MTRIRALLFALLLLPASSTVGQDRTYTMAVREVALTGALERFVDATGLALSYDPTLVRGRTASCVAAEAPAESVLACILRDSGLDFYRLSTGTYVLTERAEIAPQKGYLAGRVVDVESGSPLAGAHVLLADAHVGTVTDGSGRFLLPALLPGPYVVSVSHLGYRTWSDSLRIHPNEQTRTEAGLRPEAIVITPVVVDGTLDRPPVESLGRPALDEHVDHDVAYSGLAALAGVRLGDVTADVHVQGGDASAHQLRLDGVPVFLPRSLAGFFGPFSNLALDRITVHKAGFSAAEGSHLGGVVLADHALSGRPGLVVQADPYSLNARARVAPGGRITAMAAARAGLSSVYSPSRLHQMLRAWSRPDPFLLLAPLETTGFDYALENPGEWLESPPNPVLRFHDLHAAARIRFGPLRSLHVSAYEGSQALEGGILSGIGRQDAVLLPTVADDYAWTNRLGQITYEAVLGRRTLARFQARASAYSLQNDYKTVDGYQALVQADTIRLTALTTVPARDENRMMTAAVEGTLDHAFERHHAQIGLESGVLDSRFDLRSVFFPRARDIGEFSEGTLTDAVQSEHLVQSTSGSVYAAVFGEDRARFGDRLSAELGLRATYLNVRRTVYAEPRLALLYHGDGSAGAWSGRTSAGIYRQFLNQTDASRLNAGALLPSVRVWLPVDGTVRPAVSYHLAQELLLQVSRSVSLQAEAYVKREPRGLALRYAQADSMAVTQRRVSQRDIYADARSDLAGGGVGIAWKSGTLRAEARFAVEWSRRTSTDLFGGRSHPVPWSEPQRLEIAADWQPTGRVVISARWKGVWNRPWGFRRVYYDYFGHGAGTRLHPPYDLGDPGAHVLPPLYQLDLSAAYTQPLGTVDVQVRADVVNAAGRRNVLDWRLVPDGSTWRKEARTLYPFMPSVAVRVRF